MSNFIKIRQTWISYWMETIFAYLMSYMTFDLHTAKRNSYPFHAGHPGDHRVTPRWHSFHTGERDREGSRVNLYPFMAHSKPARARAELKKNRKPSKTKLELWHSIRIWRMHIHFARFVLWRNNDRPDFTRVFNRDAFHAAISPGCTREFNRDDWRVTFPKSLPAFYSGFYPRDLSHCDITRVHPGEICSAWKGYQPVLWYHVHSYQISLKSVKHYWSYRTETIFAYLMSYDLWPIYSKVELGL